MSAFGHAQMGSCTNKGAICYRSSETGELWCGRLGRWCEKCPKDEATESGEDNQ